MQISPWWGTCTHCYDYAFAMTTCGVVSLKQTQAASMRKVLLLLCGVAS